MSQLKSRENSTTKLTAAGDGIRKRVPISSSRKFTPIPNKSNENIKNELLLALDELENKQKIQKAKSVAEITPTKSKSSQEKSKCKNENKALVILHGTPRDSLAVYFNKKAAARLIFKNLLIFSWRSFRTRLITITATSQQQEDQIFQLKMQIDVLENLRQSETNRSNETTAICQQLRNELGIVQQEKMALVEDQLSKDQHLNKLQENIFNLINNLEDIKDELRRERLKVENNVEKNALMAVELSRRSDAIIIQNAAIENLQNTIEAMGKDLNDLQILQEVQQKENVKLIEKLDVETWSRNLLENESQNLSKIINNLQTTIDELQIQLMILNDKKESWCSNAVQFGKLSWLILLKAVTILLPALNY